MRDETMPDLEVVPTQPKHKNNSLTPGFLLGVISGVIGFFLLATPTGRKVRTQLEKDIGELAGAVRRVDQQAVRNNKAVLLAQKIYHWLLRYARVDIQ